MRGLLVRHGGRDERDRRGRVRLWSTLGENPLSCPSAYAGGGTSLGWGTCTNGKCASSKCKYGFDLVDGRCVPNGVKRTQQKVYRPKKGSKSRPRHGFRVF